MSIKRINGAWESQNVYFEKWEDVVDCMDEDALGMTFDDETWEDGNLEAMLNVYCKYHREVTGTRFNVFYLHLYD